jgi:hypothetical protein
MQSQGPFREEDVRARVNELRAERERLARQLATTLDEVRRSSSWSWGRFLLGLALMPVAIVASAVLARLFG